MKIGDRVKSKMTFIKHHGTVIDRQERFYPFATASISSEKFRVEWDDGDMSGWLFGRELILMPSARPWLSKMQRHINGWWKIREDERVSEMYRREAIKDPVDAMMLAIWYCGEDVESDRHEDDCPVTLFKEISK